MKVLLINGSPRKNGCTFTALSEVAGELEKLGISTEIYWIGNKPVPGCISCNSCTKTGKCVFDDQINEVVEKMWACDGFVFGSPVYYAGINGSMMSFMDRLCYSSSRNGLSPMSYKPCAAVVSARRAGTTSALDQLGKYLMYSGSVVIGSQYWAMVHGNTPEQVRQDAEGLQIMRTLGRNMAWFLKIKEAGLAAGVEYPEREEKVFTNFIR